MKERINNEEYMPKQIEIPEKEIRFSFSHSSGAGGQNVNKRETRVIVFWNVQDSQVLNEAQKGTLLEKLKNKIDTNGDIIVDSQKTRSQEQNKRDAINKLNILVNEALKAEKARIPTKVPLREKKKRLENKKRKAAKKKLRGKITF